MYGNLKCWNFIPKIKHKSVKVRGRTDTEPKCRVDEWWKWLRSCKYPSLIGDTPAHQLVVPRGTMGLSAAAEQRCSRKILTAWPLAKNLRFKINSSSIDMPNSMWSLWTPCISMSIYFCMWQQFFSAATCDKLESSTHQSKILCACAGPEYNTFKIKLTNSPLFPLAHLKFDCYKKFWKEMLIFFSLLCYMLKEFGFLNDFRSKCSGDEESGVFRRVIGQHGSSDRTYWHPVWQSHHQRRQWVRASFHKIFPKRPHGWSNNKIDLEKNLN